jgi:midasin
MLWQVLLDELNLASQSVLEGLNACLDHRAEVFLPELGRAFACPPSFRIFAAQNPLQQGGGRKGLPRSFLNRFTSVRVGELDAADLLLIALSAFPDIGEETLRRMISFNAAVQHGASREFASSGRPWEFNLRDILRWCELMRHYQVPVPACAKRSIFAYQVPAPACAAGRGPGANCRPPRTRQRCVQRLV